MLEFFNFVFHEIGTLADLCLALWVKYSADDILKYFFYFSQKIGFVMSCKVSPNETICTKCHYLFSSAELAQSDKG